VHHLRELRLTQIERYILVERKQKGPLMTPLLIPRTSPKTNRGVEEGFKLTFEQRVA
jgi:hypothetical protein